MHYSAPDTKQPNIRSPCAEIIRKNDDPESGSIVNSVGANEEENKNLTRADPKASPVAKAATNNETKTGVKLYNQMKQIPGAVLAFSNDAARKLILIPRIIMFMPMDLILRPGAAKFGMDNYGDARDKIHNKSSLRLLFEENDMNWIMSMIFYCENADAKPLLYFSAIAGAAFGSIHCAAWNFDFQIGRAHV